MKPLVNQHPPHIYTKEPSYIMHTNKHTRKVWVCKSYSAGFGYCHITKEEKYEKA